MPALCDRRAVVLVPKERLELSWVTPIDFESIASAIPPLRQLSVSLSSLLKKTSKIKKIGI